MKEESEDDHAAVYPSYEGCQEGRSSIPGTEKALVIQVTMIGYEGENECIDKTKESDYTVNGNIPFADPKYSEICWTALSVPTRLTILSQSALNGGQVYKQ
uniref:Uncharacterized protein n=1 Tax=Fusarium oxysporum (strain Fo5176) TaxID=660025 RepID=A0A0C4DJ22_FUSOF